MTSANLPVDWHAQELLLLHEVMKLVGRSLSPEPVLREMLHLMSELLGLNRGRIVLVDEDDHQQARIHLAYGLTAAERRRGRYAPGEGITGRVLASGQAIIVQDIDADPLFLFRSVRREQLPEDTVAFLALPIEVDGRVSGVLACHRIRSRRRRLNDDLAVLRTLATLTGQLLQLERLVQAQTAQLQARNAALTRALDSASARYGLIGRSPALLQALGELERVSQSQATVLLLGESGTGKELFARAVHLASGRRDQGQAGMQDMAPGEFYKNKPGNFEKIKRQRLTRYVLTDHTSGSIFVHYVAGGESVVNMAEAFLAAIAQRPDAQMYGVPFHLMKDPGSAGIGGAFRNLLRRLQVKPVVNMAGNPRAKGQVENAHNLVETNFESGFKFTHVPDIGWINAQAAQWMRWYNGNQVHSRHGMTRWAKWLQITQQQLRLVDADIARQLLTHEPETPKVRPNLTVRFAGRWWDVRDVPGVLIGEKLQITFNPFDRTAAMVVQHDADGHEQLLPVAEAKRGEHGFREGAAHIAREMKSMPDTVASANRKKVERLATGAETDKQAAAARKANVIPFAGAMNPYAHHQASQPAVTVLPRRGTVLNPAVRVGPTAVRLLNHFEAARALVRMGVAMSPELIETLKSRHADGVPEDQLNALAVQLTVPPSLRKVAGGTD